jgi:hypothetical protein
VNEKIELNEDSSQQATRYPKEKGSEPARSKLRGIAPKEIELLLSYIERKITVEQLRDALGKIKPAYETNRLLNQINSTNDAEAIQSFVTDALSDLVN